MLPAEHQQEIKLTSQTNEIYIWQNIRKESYKASVLLFLWSPRWNKYMYVYLKEIHTIIQSTLIISYKNV